MKLTFIEYLIEAKHIGYAPEFEFANGQVFDADMAIDPNSSDAQKIISKIQRPKVDALAQLLDIRWTMLFANSHEQHDRWRGTSRLVWSYILVGNDPDGNEIAYYKYEAGPGSGQSHVYGNRKNKTKLTWILDSTSTEAKARLGLVAKTNKPSEAVPTDEKDLVRLLKKRFKGATYSRDNQDRLRMLIRYPTSTHKWMRAQRGISFIFKPYGGKMIVTYQQLYGAKEVKRGYDISYGATSKVGTFDDVVSMIQKMRLKRNDLK